MDANISLCYCYCFTHLQYLADLSQQAKSAAADGLTYSDSIDKKSAGNFNLSTFCPLEKTFRPSFSTQKAARDVLDAF
jgi:hypothetical protein